VPGAGPSGIAASGGALWFTMHLLDKIGRIETDGVPITEFGPTGDEPSGIALGPDGALWFTETNAGKVGRMTTTGRVTEFALPSGGEPGEIVAGPDGGMWFTEFTGNRVGRIEAGSSVVLPPAPPRLSLTPSTAKPSTAAKKRCKVPRLRGLSVRKAKRKLRRAGCRYRMRGRGRVVASKPRAGARTRGTVQVRARPRR
jgi:DNA-binding beta-propeller fold protein YncE